MHLKTLVTQITYTQQLLKSAKFVGTCLWHVSSQPPEYNPNAPKARPYSNDRLNTFLNIPFAV